MSTPKTGPESKAPSSPKATSTLLQFDAATSSYISTAALPTNGASNLASGSIFPRTTAAIGGGSVPPGPAEENDFLARLRQSRGLILSVAFLVFACVMAWTCLAGMKFTAKGQLYLGELGRKNVSADGAHLDLSPTAGSDLGSEVKILESRTLVSRAVLTSGANVELTPFGSKPPVYWRWRWSRRNVETLDVAYRQLRVVNARFASTGHPEAKYVLTAASDHEFELFNRVTATSLGRLQFGEPATLGDLSLTVLAGVAPVAVGDQFELTVSCFDDVMAEVDKDFVVEVPKPAAGVDSGRIVGLSFTHRSPNVASLFLQTLMGDYLLERHSWRTEEADVSQTFVSDQLSATKAKLDELQNQLVLFRASNPGVVLSAESTAMAGQMGKYEEQRAEARIELSSLSNIKRGLSGNNASVGSYLVGEAGDPVLSEMASNLVRARQNVSDLRARFSAAAPDVKEAQAQLEGHLETIRGYVSSRTQRAQQRLGAVEQVIQQYENKVKNVPAAEVQLGQLSREAEVYQTLYSTLLKKQQETAIQRASTVSSDRILDAAIIPSRESSPKLALRLLSAPFGVLLGIFYALGRGVLRGRFNSNREVSRSFGEFPVLANLPRFSRKASGRGADLFSGQYGFEFVEAMRLLRANLTRAFNPSSGLTVLITSPTAGDGKTVCTLSLAAALAAEGRSVLVVDADLRKAPHSKLLGLPQEPSLTGLLAEQADWQEAVHRVKCDGGEFYSIVAGQGGGAELLSKAMVGRLIRLWRGAFDVILIDTPAFPVVADALVITPLADLVLSVIRVGHTPQHEALEHVSRIAEACNNLALVINGESGAGHGYRRSYVGSNHVRGALGN